MDEIFQSQLPAEMQTPLPLPGVAPCAPNDWLRVDDAYAQQMACRTALLAQNREAVLWAPPDAHPACLEVLEAALLLLPDLGFEVGPEVVICPDGRHLRLNREEPLQTLGHLVQEDICILQKRGDEHVLSAAVLCFPANWRLADKAGRPLTTIHDPVKEYDDKIAQRVQRLFDGVRVGRPLWRCNRLKYAHSALHQPRRREVTQPLVFQRSERQCILRLPQTQAVVFSIHTWVLDQRCRAD